MATDAVIVAEGLTKVYGSGENRVEALAGASFRIEQGEWVAIVGRSGSGKSTLLNVLGLLDRPTEGRYLLDGREVSGLSGSALAKARSTRSRPNGSSASGTVSSAEGSVPSSQRPTPQATRSPRVTTKAGISNLPMRKP